MQRISVLPSLPQELTTRHNCQNSQEKCQKEVLASDGPYSCSGAPCTLSQKHKFQTVLCFISVIWRRNNGTWHSPPQQKQPFQTSKNPSLFDLGRPKTVLTLMVNKQMSLQMDVLLESNKCFVMRTSQTEC